MWYCSHRIDLQKEYDMDLKKLVKNPVVEIRKMQLRSRYADDFVEQIESGHAVPLGNCADTYTVIIPEKVQYHQPVILVGGFSQGIQAYADEIHDLHTAGYVTIYTNPVKGYTGLPSAVHGQFQGVYTVPDIVLRKVLAIDAILCQLDAQTYHLVGHSQGGMLATHVAALHADKVATLTLVSPEGFQKDQAPFLIASKFAYQAADQMVDIVGQVIRGDTQLLEPSGRAGRTFMRNFFQQPLWRLTDEVPEGIQVDLAGLLRYLKESPVQVTFVTAHKDQLFTVGEYREYLERDYGTGGGDVFALIDSWVSFARKGAGHTALGIEQPGILKQILQSDN